MRVDSRILSPFDREMIQVLEYLHHMESNILIAQDREYDHEVGEYLSKGKLFLSLFHHMVVL